MSLGLLIQSPSLSLTFLSFQSHSPGIFAKAKEIGLKDRLLIHHVTLNTCLTALNQILTRLAESKSTDRKCKQKN